MNKIAIQLLLKLAEDCRDRFDKTASLSKRSALSKSYAEVTDILEQVLEFESK